MHEIRRTVTARRCTSRAVKCRVEKVRLQLRNTGKLVCLDEALGILSAPERLVAVAVSDKLELRKAFSVFGV